MHEPQYRRTCGSRSVHDGTAQSVLRDVDLTVEPGEFVSLIGHSGCGKSTLLNVVGGLLELDAGHDHASTASRSPDRAPTGRWCSSTTRCCPG